MREGVISELFFHFFLEFLSFSFVEEPHSFFLFIEFSVVRLLLFFYFGYVEDGGDVAWFHWNYRYSILNNSINHIQYISVTSIPLATPTSKTQTTISRLSHRIITTWTCIRWDKVFEAQGIGSLGLLGVCLRLIRNLLVFSYRLGSLKILCFVLEEFLCYFFIFWCFLFWTIWNLSWRLFTFIYAVTVNYYERIFVPYFHDWLRHSLLWFFCRKRFYF